MIIRSNREFRSQFHQLGKNDCIIRELNLKNCEESLFLDLVERGVTLFPPAISQQLSRSKCLQAVVFAPFMLPLTTVVKSRHEMILCIEKYGAHKIGPVITKQDRLDCGLGINLWKDIEDTFNATCFGGLSYPFVIQPFQERATDMRVIIIGDYTESYWRNNPSSFRNNLHFGGQSQKATLSEEQKKFCTEVMHRGKFPYAHIDILITEDGRHFLSEISLSGGIRGAQITPAEYKIRIREIQNKFVRDFTTSL